MLQPNSPLFAPNQLQEVENNSFVPTLPEHPLASTSSLQVYIIPAEKNIFLEGFNEQEFADRPPTILRGCLYIRVLKPTKIKSISLTFKGLQRTDWPEGIPPKKNVFSETVDIVSHTWPFYTSGVPSVNGGADHYQELPVDNKDTMRSISPMPIRRGESGIAPLESSTIGGISDFLSRTMSLSPAAGLARRARSPSGSIHPSNSHTDLQSVISNTNEDKDGFVPGDYIYNFEHPIQPSMQESIKVTYGEVSYFLEATIQRQGAFNKNISVKHPVKIIRVLSSANLEENEPIVISRDWEDQIQYDIVVGSKSVVLNSYLPISFKFIPLWGKVALHRIRIYLTENMEYFCTNKKVHRMEPAKKYLLLEHKALKGKSLLSKSGGLVESESNEEIDDVLPRELQFHVFVPHTINEKYHNYIHPDTSVESIKAHHWIKMCLRISRKDPNNPEKRKHYEISIDSPIRILSELSVHANTLLPVYHQPQADPFLPVYSPSDPPSSPGIIPIDGNNNHVNINGFLGPMEGGEQSLDAIMDQEEEFPMLASSISRDVPLERDSDHHLEANLYKPPDTIEPAMRTPQAMPMSSPIGSPMLSPIRICEPSNQPPSFAEASMTSPPSMSILPPEYKVEQSSTRGRNRNPIPKLDKKPSNVSLLNDVPEVESKDSIKSGRSSLSNNSYNSQGTSMATNSSKNDQQSNNEPAASTTNIPRILEPSLPEQDIADTYGPPFADATTPMSHGEVENGNLSPRIGMQSRKSSTSSVISSQLEELSTPIENIPLLNSSSASLEYPKSRGNSVISLLHKNFIEHDDLYHINRNLQQLRNPRIKKHYQEEQERGDELHEDEVDEDEVDELNEAVGNIDDTRGRANMSTTSQIRHKSFGVIDGPISKCLSNSASS